MKKLMVICMLLVSSSVFAWSSAFDVFAAELMQIVPETHSKGVIAYGQTITLYSSACVDNNFINKLQRKYSSRIAHKHMVAFGYNTIVCNNGSTGIIVGSSNLIN